MSRVAVCKRCTGRFIYGRTDDKKRRFCDLCREAIQIEQASWSDNKKARLNGSMAPRQPRK